MRSRRIYMLIVVLGLAMVWLGFLFTYELKIVDRSTSSTEQQAIELSNSLQQDEEQAQTAGVSSGEAVDEAGTGFPLALAGLGLIFVVGGAFNFRHNVHKK